MVPVPRFLSPRLHDKRCEAKRRKTANDVESKPESKTTSGRTSPEGDGVPVMGDGDVTMDMGPIMPSFLNLTREGMLRSGVCCCARGRWFTNDRDRNGRQV